MKKVFLLFLILLAMEKNYCQISATTTHGKSVILNSNGTWTYSDKKLINAQQNGCEEAQTGNITVVNKNKNNIYFYYSGNEDSITGLKMIKIKAGDTKLIRDISRYYARGGIYDWKAVLKITERNIPLSAMQGIASGTFLVVKCGNKELEIGD